MKMVTMIKQIAGVLATGYILTFYSEHLFWAHARPGDSLTGWLMTWLVYSLLGYAFLTLVNRFQARTIWAVFLCGAAFGWLAEGLVVQTAYENLPLSISFTGLAWHASISVLVGWRMVRHALQAGFKQTLLLSALTGALYGFWAISWWNEPGERITPLSEFAVYALVTQGLVVLAYWIESHTIRGTIKPNRPWEITLGALALLTFVFVTIPAAPKAAWILPALLLIVFFSLRCNLANTGNGENRSFSQNRIPFRNFMGLWALPLAAILVYALAAAAGLRWHTNWAFYLVTTPLGFVLLLVSLFKIRQQKLVHP